MFSGVGSDGQKWILSKCIVCFEWSIALCMLPYALHCGIHSRREYLWQHVGGYRVNKCIMVSDNGGHDSSCDVITHYPELSYKFSIKKLVVVPLRPGYGRLERSGLPSVHY